MRDERGYTLIELLIGLDGLAGRAGRDPGDGPGRHRRPEPCRAARLAEPARPAGDERGSSTACTRPASRRDWRRCGTGSTESSLVLYSKSGSAVSPTPEQVRHLPLGRELTETGRPRQRHRTLRTGPSARLPPPCNCRRRQHRRKSENRRRPCRSSATSPTKKGTVATTPAGDPAQQRKRGQDGPGRHRLHGRAPSGHRRPGGGDHPDRLGDAADRTGQRGQRPGEPAMRVRLREPASARRAATR